MLVRLQVRFEGCYTHSPFTVLIRGERYSPTIEFNVYSGHRHFPGSKEISLTECRVKVPMTHDTTTDLNQRLELCRIQTCTKAGARQREKVPITLVYQLFRLPFVTKVSLLHWNVVLTCSERRRNRVGYPKHSVAKWTRNTGSD